MNFSVAEKIANAVLYEGYMLYPYRPSSLKNQHRWNFGTLYPAQYEEVRRGTERTNMHVECLLRVGAPARIEVRVRYLELARKGNLQWDECIERTEDFQIAMVESSSPAIQFQGSAGVNGSLHLQLEGASSDGSLRKLSLDLVNDSACERSAAREIALAHSLISAHMILAVEDGEFISLLDPPDNLREQSAGCKNVGCFPVLVGDEGQRNMLLCSPIIIYDYPQIAPESAGDFFDGTEMDEMLTLRVMTMTDDEKAEAISADRHARHLLERTEQTAREQLTRTHGTIRGLRQVTGNE